MHSFFVPTAPLTQCHRLQVWAKAKATCTGNGNVYGCAAAYATANRWAAATASAYAFAYADAYNYCKCNKKPQDAGAYAFGSAEEVRATLCASLLCPWRPLSHQLLLAAVHLTSCPTHCRSLTTARANVLHVNCTSLQSCWELDLPAAISSSRRQICVCVCLQMKDLVAKVSATAEADVCIDGTGSATAYVESHCLQAIYANVWAKVRLATRGMSIYGVCLSDHAETSTITLSLNVCHEPQQHCAWVRAYMLDSMSHAYAHCRL